jgi:ABC-type glutathione transport system ATPase component
MGFARAVADRMYFFDDGMIVESGSPEDIPLPVSKIDPIHTRNLWGLFYETGARLYHFIQRRV